MKKELISIIVPVYNVEKYLCRCLDSIVAQTYFDWEAVLVDDGSIDKSGAICDEYASLDHRFKVVHKQNEGVAKARITAFEYSQGEFITFVDADDYISPEYLEKLSAPIIENEADMVSCDYCKVEKGKTRMTPAKFTGTYEEEQITEFIEKHYFYDETTKGYGMACCLWSKMIRREYVLEGLEHGRGMWFGEDQISMFTMLLSCRKLVLISDRLYYYVQHEGQAVKRYDGSLWDNIIMLLSRYKTLIPNIKCLPGLHRRTWEYIKRTIINKMMPANVSMNVFMHHLSKMRSHSYMEQFFKTDNIYVGKKDKIIYWLLRERHFIMLFFLLKIRMRNK